MDQRVDNVEIQLIELWAQNPMFLPKVGFTRTLFLWFSTFG